MRFLLDTHVLVWFRARPEELGAACRRLLQDPETACALSVVTALELAQLVYRGRLSLPQPVDDWFATSVRQFNALTIGISPKIAAEAYRLPGDFHPDPADRLLVATARIENATLVTADRRILRFRGVTCFDARE